MKVAVEDDADDSLRNALAERLVAFNRRVTGDGPSGKYLITLRDDDGALRGGAWVRFSADTAFIDIVYVDEELRGEGHGAAAIRAAEEEARKRGATTAWLYTATWQARPFYEKLGYVCVGEMPMMGGRHKRQFLWKAL